MGGGGDVVMGCEVVNGSGLIMWRHRRHPLCTRVCMRVCVHVRVCACVRVIGLVAWVWVCMLCSCVCVCVCVIGKAFPDGRDRKPDDGTSFPVKMLL